MNESKFDIFISHAKEDSQLAKRLYNDLVNNNISCWLASEHLLPGQKWKDKIVSIIKNCKYFIILLSKNSVSKRGFIQKELKIALDMLLEYPENDIFIIPIRVEKCYPSNSELFELHWIDFFQSWNDGLSKILNLFQKNANNCAKCGNLFHEIKTNGDIKKICIVCNPLQIGKCPICGKRLRSIKSQQCKHCFSSWHSDKRADRYSFVIYEQ